MRRISRFRSLSYNDKSKIFLKNRKSVHVILLEMWKILVIYIIISDMTTFETPMGSRNRSRMSKTKTKMLGSNFYKKKLCRHLIIENKIIIMLREVLWKVDSLWALNPLEYSNVNILFSSKFTLNLNLIWINSKIIEDSIVTSGDPKNHPKLIFSSIKKSFLNQRSSRSFEEKTQEFQWKIINLGVWSHKSKP